MPIAPKSKRANVMYLSILSTYTVQSLPRFPCNHCNPPTRNSADTLRRIDGWPIRSPAMAPCGGELTEEARLQTKYVCGDPRLIKANDSSFLTWMDVRNSITGIHITRTEQAHQVTMSSTATATTTTKTEQQHSLAVDDSKYDFKNLKPYVHPPETKADLPWSELVTLDLEDYNRPGGKERLAKQLEHAVHHVGFFYVKNYGLTQEQVDRQFTLAQNVFELPVEEKEKYEVNYAAADYNGWRRPHISKASAASFGNIEMYNMAKFTPDFEDKYDHPDLVKAHLPEIKVFQRALHENVVLPLLRLFAIVLKLPDEEYLVKQHSWDKKSEDHFRYMLYYPRTEEEWAAADYGKKGGHTDLG